MRESHSGGEHVGDATAMNDLLLTSRILALAGAAAALLLLLLLRHDQPPTQTDSLPADDHRVARYGTDTKAAADRR